MKFRLLTVLFLLIGGSALAEPFKVGFIAPLTGPLGEYGVAAKNGVELARKEFSDRFEKLEFVFEDSQYQPMKAVTAFQKLRNVDDVDLVFDWGNSTSEAVVPIAERQGVPIISLSGNSQTFRGKKFAIRFFPTLDEFGEKLAKFVREKDFKRIAIVKNEINFFTGILNALKRNVGSGVTVTDLDAYGLDATDFKSSVAKIARSDFDAIGVFLISGQASQFYRQLAQQGVKLPTLSTDILESRVEIKAAGPAINGAVYPYTNVSKDFYERYQVAYGNDNQIASAGNSYDLAIMLADLFGAAEPATPKQIIQKLTATGSRTGVSGVFTYNETPALGRYFQFPIFLKQINGNEIQVIE